MPPRPRAAPSLAIGLREQPPSPPSLTVDLHGQGLVGVAGAVPELQNVLALGVGGRVLLAARVRSHKVLCRKQSKGRPE